MKLAVSPMIQILGEGAVQGLAGDEKRRAIRAARQRRSVAGDRARVRVDRFLLAGRVVCGRRRRLQAAPRVGIAASFTRSWGGEDSLGATRDRRDLTGSVWYLIASRVAVYGSIGRTIATTDENGAGTTVSGGVAFFFVRAERRADRRRPPDESHRNPQYEVRPEGLEPPAYWFEASRSIQLSYGRHEERVFYARERRAALW